jgi:hypothetical protein
MRIYSRSKIPGAAWGLTRGKRKHRCIRFDSRSNAPSAAYGLTQGYSLLAILGGQHFLEHLPTFDVDDIDDAKITFPPRLQLVTFSGFQDK